MAMADDDVIAFICIRDHADRAYKHLIEQDANKKYHVPENPRTLRLPYLALRFSDPPKSRGFIIGTDQDKEARDIFVDNSDIPDSGKQISNRHCFITFDDQYRLVLVDISQNGTTVLYNGHGNQCRHHFTWILDPIIGAADIIDVKLPNNISFQVVQPDRNRSSKAYIDKVKKFRETVLKEYPDDPSDLRLTMQTKDNVQTAAPSGTTSLGREPVFIQCGPSKSGAFGTVYHVCNVSTGQHVARKCPKDDNYVMSHWNREIAIMRDIDHPHIIKFLGARMFNGRPMIDLEWAPEGDFGKVTHFRYEEALKVLNQCLQALEYLHNSERSLTHRDIKPENILVMSRHPISVKLADFGISKRDSPTDTMIGTREALAPEIARYYETHPGKKIPVYTSAVDIWALGVSIVHLYIGLELRDSKNCSALEWCKRVQLEVKKRALEHDSGLTNLFNDMLSDDPKDRPSARSCLTELNACKAQSPLNHRTLSSLRHPNHPTKKEKPTTSSHTRSRKDKFQSVASSRMIFYRPTIVRVKWEAA